MDLEFKLRSLYICVKNMERAIEFYEDLLGQKVTEKNDIYSVFDINGFRYGLFASEKMNEVKKWGNNCLPSLEVSNIDLVLKKLEKLNCKIVFPLTIIGENQVLEFKDSEGNDIEITRPLY
ncbi:VOC family protein [Clostridium botulinum]|uniref:VOC family protein n=1 Tax=Clostridium botulinum TaxID=1491 RepID=UPI001E082240